MKSLIIPTAIVTLALVAACDSYSGKPASSQRLREILDASEAAKNKLYTELTGYEFGPPVLADAGDDGPSCGEQTEEQAEEIEMASKSIRRSLAEMDSLLDFLAEIRKENEIQIDGACR